MADPFRTVAEQFAAELRKLHTRMSNENLASEIQLKVTLHSGKARFEIIASYAWGAQRVSGSELGIVMDELYRRLNYEDKEAERIATSMTALTDDRHNLDGNI